jgi:uncharacterized membrane protein YccC
VNRMSPRAIVRPTGSRPICIAFGLVSAGLALHFWILCMQPSAGLAAPWYGFVAELFSAFAVGAIACWILAVLIRRRMPALAEAASWTGCVCGLIPPVLIVAFVLVNTFG